MAPQVLGPLLKFSCPALESNFWGNSSRRTNNIRFDLAHAALNLFAGSLLVFKYPYAETGHLLAVIASAVAVQLFALFSHRGFYEKYRLYITGGVHLVQLYCERSGIYILHESPIFEDFVTRCSWTLTLIYSINLALNSVMRRVPFRMKLFMQLLTVAGIVHAQIGVKAKAWLSASALYGASNPLLLPTCFRAFATTFEPALWLSPWFPSIPAIASVDGCTLRQACCVDVMTIIVFGGVVPLALDYLWELQSKCAFFRWLRPEYGPAAVDEHVLLVCHLWSVQTLVGVWLLLSFTWHWALPGLCSISTACHVSGP